MANWVLRSQTGKVKGPYSTHAIMQMIEKGQLLGSEQISEVPNGQWTELSRVPHFYDKILEQLEGDIKPADPAEQKQREETVIQPPPQKENDESILRKAKVDSVIAPTPLPRKPEVPESKTQVKTNTQSVIELKSLPNFKKEELKKNFIMPGAILLLIGLLGYLLFGDSKGGDSSNKISLIGPTEVRNDLDAEEIKLKLNEALLEIESDEFKSYLRAQNLLVSIVENSQQLPRQQQLEARALLCTVYKQLWPHTKQSAQDIQVVKNVRDTTRALDVTSPYGDICEIVRVTTQSSLKEIKATIDAVFAKKLTGFNMLPVLYQMKGELLDIEKDYLNATGFFTSSIQLWPKWNRPQVDLAYVLMKSKKNEELSRAAQLLRSVLEKNPQHKTARYLLGIMEYEDHRNNDNAFEQLSLGVESEDRASISLEIKAYQIYANLLLARGEKSSALDYAQKALALNPNSPELKELVLRLGGDDKSVGKSNHLQMLYMGEVYEKQGDCLAAQAEYKAAFEVDNKNGLAALKAGKCLWQINQSFEAIEWLKKAIRAEPKLVSSYVTLADYLSQRYDFVAATQVLASANRENPKSYEVMKGFALLEYRKGNLRGAIDYAKRSSAIYDGDIETFIILSKASAELAAASLAVSKTDIDKRRVLAEEAFRFATKAIEMGPTDVQAQINYANVTSLVQGSGTGIRHLEEKIRAFGFEIEYKVALGELLMKEEKYTDSQKIFEGVIAVDRRNKKAWLGLGISQRARGQNSQALKSFIEAAILDPTDVEGSFQAGKIYYETDVFDKAIEQFQRVNKINPNYPRAHYFIGKTALASGNYDLAIEAAKKEQQLNPQLADPYILMGEVYAVRGQYADCANAYSQAIKFRPQGAITYVRAAECYRQSGSVDIAEDMLDLALARENGLADIYRELGVIYELKGDFRGAYEAYNKYLGLSPNAPDKMMIDSKMQSLRGR
ncbi:MAG: tetratricopeptide repeat protein [Bdellovibrionia bacterium]